MVKTFQKQNQYAWSCEFLDFSDDHSSLVVNVRNLTTGYVSPQFHVVVDDLFQTVFNLGENDTLILMQFAISHSKVIRMSMLKVNSVWMGNLSILCLLQMRFGSLN